MNKEVQIFPSDDLVKQIINWVANHHEANLSLILYEFLGELNRMKSDGQDFFETAYYMNQAERMICWQEDQEVPSEKLFELVERCYTVGEDNHFSEMFSYFDYVRAAAHLCSEDPEKLDLILGMTRHDFSLKVFEQAEIDRADYDHM